MNRFFNSLAAFALTFACLAPLSAVKASDEGVTLVVIAEDLPTAAKAEIQKQFVKILADKPAGHKLVVVRGRDHTPVTNLTLPKVKPRERFRDRGLKKSLGKLKTFLLAKPDEEALGQIGIPNLPNTYGQLASGHGPCNIILCGNPIFQEDDRYLFWNFSNRKFPTDPAIVNPLSGCPFVNRGAKPIPADVKIAILSPPSWGASEQHRGYVSRWLVLAFQESLGGSLVRISNSAKAVFGFQGMSEFETVVPRKNRTKVGMWELAKDGTLMFFPQEGEPKPRELSQNAEKMQQQDERETGRVSERTRGRPNRDLSNRTEVNNSRTDEGRVRTIEQNFDSSLEDEESRAGPLRSIETDSRLPAGTELSNERDEQAAANPQQAEPSMMRRESARTQREQRQPSTIAEMQRPVPATAIKDIVDPPANHESGNVNESAVNSARPDNTRAPISLPAQQASNVRGKPGNVAGPLGPTLSERLQKLALSKSWPKELGNSMSTGSHRSSPGFMVVVSWQSECPHADVNLYLVGAKVRRNLVAASNEGRHDQIEWAQTHSLSVDAWLNNFFTHKQVTAKVSVIDLSTGELLEDDQELGMRCDHGHHASWRESSPAWSKFQLSSLGR